MFLLLFVATQTLVWLILSSHVPPTVALSNSISSKSQFYSNLQKCATPEKVLEAVDAAAPSTLEPAIASLVLVRLSKQLIVRDNHKRYDTDSLLSDEQVHGIRLVAARLAAAPLSKTNMEALTEGTKAYSVLLRLIQQPLNDDDVLFEFWKNFRDCVSAETTSLVWTQMEF